MCVGTLCSLLIEKRMTLKNKRQTSTSQKLQELFFSNCLTDHGPLDKRIRTHKRGDSHANAPYTKVSVEMELEIEAHLKYHLQQRHVRSHGQSTSLEKRGADVFNLLKTQTFLLKDNGLKALLDVGEHEASLHGTSKMLRSLAALGQEDEEEEEEEEEDCGVDQDVTSWMDDCPDLQRSLSKEASTGAVAGEEMTHLSEETSTHLQSHTGHDVAKENITAPCRARTKRFMVYICGGYRDTVAERTALMESVYPRLYLYCKQRGYDFSMVDLRCGVGDPVSDRHDSVELHVETLRQCQDTEGPDFFVFTGQRHEVQTPPVSISQEALESVLRVVERDRQKMSKGNRADTDDIVTSSQSSVATNNAGSSDWGQSDRDPAENSALMSESFASQSSLSGGEETRLARCWTDFDRDLTLLQTWYRLDENSVPAVYRLLPVSTHHPDFLSRDGQRRKQARRAWRTSCVRLWGVLQRSGPEALGEEATAQLLRTVLDWEVEQGLTAKVPPEEHSHCYKRIITDLQYNLRSEHAQHYIDLLKGRPEINLTLHSAHQRFIRNIHKKLRHTNIYETSVGWGRNGFNPKHNRSHKFYTERLCSHFQRTVTTALNRVMEVNSAKGSFDVRRGEASRTRIQEEILRHIRHGQALERQCVFRQDFLVEVRRAVEGVSSSQRPVLLLGEPGAGKSTTLARVAHLVRSWIPGDVKVLVCFIGLTGESRNVRLVLQSLCVQLAESYCSQAHISESLPQLSSELLSLLGLVRAESPVVLVLDGLDELSEEHGPDLTWLCASLPPHVYLILSACSQTDRAQTLQRSAQPAVLSLPPLSREEVSAGLERRLEAERRRLQGWQWSLLLQACLACPSPLYLQAAYCETRRWTSFSPQDGLALPGDMRQLYLGVLARLEREHGEALVRRAASLLSLSRGGVTEDELLSLLARDGRVLKEVALLHQLSPSPSSSSDHPRVPYVLWARLRRDLGAHVTEGESEGTWVHRWAHAELGRVCVQRYLGTADARMAAHADYADHYRGGEDPAGRGRGFQALAWTLEEGGGGTTSRVFNLRKLHGLPYHLVHSGQVVPLLNECMFNYNFLLHKVWGLSVIHVEEDLKAAVIPDKELVDVAVLAQALELSRPTLLQDPCQLASQLLGRLYQVAAEDKPVAPGDPRRFSYLHVLLSQCQHSSLPVLVPSFTSLLPPGGLTHTLLAGHMTRVTALAGGQRGTLAASCSEDGALRLWDLEEGRVVRTLPGFGGPIVGAAADSLTLCLDDSVVVLRAGQSLQVREVDSGKVLYAESDSLDVPVVTTASDGQVLVAFYDGSHLVKVFDLLASCALLCSVNITLECDPIHKDRSILVSRNSVKDYVLFAYRSGGEAAVLGARGGTVLATLKAQHAAASIQGVEMTSQYLLLFCRYPYKRHSEIVHIELFSTATFEYQRSILGCSQDSISLVTVTRGGTHALAFCPSPRSATTEIITWNLETEDHKHMARFPGLLTQGVCFDLRFCVGLCGGERYLRLWNLASRLSDQTLTYNVHKTRSDGTDEVVPMGKYPRYVVCRSLRPGTVRVWNMARAQFGSRPVRVEHGLYSSADVALARDLRLYILTDRGTDTPTDTPTPVYQTLLVYDLRKKSYVKRQTGLFIVPCPQRDYRLLQGDLLLGLSETRDHLIVWDLDTGYIRGRIKTSHRESQSLLSSTPARERQSQILPTRESKGLVMPWDRRTETHTAKRRRLEKEAQREKEEQRRLDREKYNSVDQYLLSEDEQVIVCSYFAHHLSVFSVVSQDHLHTLEDRSSLLSLHTAALTPTGGHLALANYSEAQRTPYLTLWDLQTGTVRKRLRNESGICCVAMTNDASRIAFGIAGINKVKVWDPFKRNHKTISGYGSLNLAATSKLFVTEGGAKAILLSGELSVWDLDVGIVLSVFTPDSRIQCLSLLGDDITLLLGLSDSPTLIAMKLTNQGVAKATMVAHGDDLFGESSSSEDEETRVK